MVITDKSKVCGHYPKQDRSKTIFQSGLSTKKAIWGGRKCLWRRALGEHKVIREHMGEWGMGSGDRGVGRAVVRVCGGALVLVCVTAMKAFGSVKMGLGHVNN